MPARETNKPGRFYFALPRLIAQLCGGNAGPAETNWLEANVVGGTIHAIVYVFFAHRLLAGIELWQQLALTVPVALLTLGFWLLFFYVNTVLIRICRLLGLFRNVSDAHAQGLLAGLVTTLFALDLTRASMWVWMLGAAWLILGSANLAAAVVLKLNHAAR